MKVFKQEQMYMVEEYYQLKQRDAKKEKTVNKQSRIINQQERVISDITCFLHECLDVIFAKVAEKQERIIDCIKIAKQKFPPDQHNDPFRLYQGYIEIVKPIDYETDVQMYLNRIQILEIQLADSEAKCKIIQSACEQYLKEEEELKSKLLRIQDELKVEKNKRREDVLNLKGQIKDWEAKYEYDVNKLKSQYNQLLSFTDIEREINQKIIVGYDARLKYFQSQLRSVQNILRTPRLTTIYQREMAKKIKLHKQEVLDLIETLNS